MKRILLLLFSILFASILFAQIDPELLRRLPAKTDSLSMNMDAVYNRPFIQLGKLPVAVGGYVEANYQYIGENGVTEGHQFPRLDDVVGLDPVAGGLLAAVGLPLELARRVGAVDEQQHAARPAQRRDLRDRVDHPVRVRRRGAAAPSRRLGRGRGRTAGRG